MSRQTQIEQLLRPLVESLGYEWVGVEYHPHSSNGLLRLYIDEPQVGIGLEDCEKVSREVSALMDVHDPIRGHYTLEVSSPGMDRPLFSAEQFARFVGDEANVTLAAPIDGRRKFRGVITAVDGTSISLSVGGHAVGFEFEEVVKARLVPSF